MLKQLIARILSQPTAPFRESWVMAAITSILNEHNVPFCFDAAGNLWAGISKIEQAKKLYSVFIAHTDHPGIVIESLVKKQKSIFAFGTWLGGGPKKISKHSVKVFSLKSDGLILNGRVKSHTVGSRGPNKVEIECFDPEQKLSLLFKSKNKLIPKQWGACLWFDKNKIFQGYRFEKNLCHTKAADDLIGVCSMLASLINLKINTPASPVAFLFTRAEESGFHGALEVIQRRYLDPNKTSILSVEASAQLNDAVLGGGVIVRLGDRSSIFNSNLTARTLTIAENIKNSNPHFSFQKRVMDGGSCEATAFQLYNFQAGGLSCPLRGYHNTQSTKKTPVPETININDVKTLVILICQMTRHMLDDKFFTKSLFANNKKLLKKLEVNHREHRKYYK